MRAAIPGTLSIYVAGALRGLLARYQIRQVDMAKVLGISQSHMSLILRGARPIDLDQFVTMCTALGVSAADLLDEAESFRATHRPSRVDVLVPKPVRVAEVAVDVVPRSRTELSIEAAGLLPNEAYSHIVALMRSRGVAAPSLADWREILSTENWRDVSAEVLDATGEILGVPAAFLAETDTADEAERTTAELKFRAALNETGAKFAARSTSTKAMTLVELQSITEAIRRGGSRSG